MSVSLFNQNLKEARRDALVSHYLATHDFSSLPEGSSVTTADDLYEYLLLDTKISNAVTTSRLAEAISSLQLFIHRSLEGYEGELAEEATKYLAKDAFLDNWDQYNKRYSTWAGKEKLRFYAGNYVEPSLRNDKTELFKYLENNINQTKLTEESVFAALNGYFSQYKELTGINILTVSYSDYARNRYFLLGKSAGNYYLRILDSQRSDFYAWGEWLRLPFLNGRIASEKDVSILKQNDNLIVLFRYEKKSENENGDGYDSSIVYEAYELTEDNGFRKCQSFISLTEPYDGEHNNPISHGEGLYKTFYSDIYFKRIDANTFKITNKSVWNGERTIKYYKEDTNDYFTLKYGESSFVSLFEGDRLRIDGEGDDTLINCSSSFFFDDRTDYNHQHTQIDIAGNVILFDDEESTFNTTPPALFINTLINQNQYIGEQGYELQKSLIADNPSVFSGAYGQYLWEIFFHIPYLVATRFATEQRFEEAERWYKYIFNSAGYRDEDGHIQTDDNGRPRYWNCYPLQQDVDWDSFADMPASTDPDVIATADPMHYKLAIFRHTLDLLIARGDAAWRLLERDTLTEAKMYYVQALQLLGPRPDIRVTNTWDNPTLSVEADAIQIPATRSGEGASLTFAQWLRAGDTNEMGDGDFLPPYNDVLLAYWDKLDIRMYNLRHNLSLDGQPLSLPLYATPVDPAELHRQQSGGDGIQGDIPPAARADTGWRYPLLAVKAQEAVNRLREFGSGLLSALEKQDNEKVAMLLQSQQSNVLGMQQEIAQKNLEGLNAELAALNNSREGLVLNQKYYTSLVNGDLSAAEIAGLTLRSGSMLLNTSAGVTLLPAGALRAIPNIFGMADGGADLGAPVESSAFNMQIAAQVLDQSAQVSEVTASYQRRAADWRQQSALTTKSIEEIDNRIASLKAQIAMQQKQIALAEMEYANHQAYLDLYNSRFTGLTLYSWMVTRLSSLYYQLYDATLPVCIHALEALKRELGKNRADGIFSMPVWNDLYQGLLAGEGLTTELQKLEDIWLQNSANGLEATRTVSLAALRGEKSGSLSASIAKVLNNKEEGNVDDQLKLDGNIFSAVLDMSKLQLANDYGVTGSNKNLFTKSISVTLPTLLGPYQDIAATLSDGNGTVATLSHGMQDTGRFVVNFDDSRFLPFEGSDPTSLILTLSIFNVKESGDAAPNQRAIVENLSDIIFHIRYIMRDRQS
ncbi:Uncharacterised protein [Enterobacter cancerogenus]|uniref:Insecticidal toxin complex protein TccB n=1 Tax=Enterobacter cancerogenus TaxID=69218 RepID=A0A484WVA1_9ENTR|nr:Uncharacterised protein [Enterobacter cancerogenus]